MAGRFIRGTIGALLLAGALGGCRVGEVQPGGRPEAPAAPADNAAAAVLLSDARAALERGDASTARAGAEEILSRYGRTSSALPARWLLARAALALGDYDVAIEAAERYAERVEGAARREALELERTARAARERAADAVAIGVMLPRSNAPYLEQYAELVMEGIQLAVEEYAGAGVLDLITLDDEGDPSRNPALMEQLTGRGARVVVGPMLTAGLRAAALARDGDTPVLISPTASEPVQGLPNVYTLNAGDTRAAQALAEYAAQGGLARAAVLFPRIDRYQRQAEAFLRAFEDRGGLVTAFVPFDSGTTTFGPQLERLARGRPDVVYMPLTTDGVRLVAPQVSYYGVDSAGAVLLGGEAWADEEVLRVVERRYLDSVVVAVPVPEPNVARARPEFVRRYEERYRRSLDNPFPALGYDAARLALEALVPGQNRPEQIAARLRRLEAFEGATGRISVRDGRLTREPLLMQFHDGVLVPAPPPASLPRPLPVPIDSAAPVPGPPLGGVR